jgi:outer membrane autotransporter protein
VTVGADYRFTDAFVAGFAVGYAKSNADFDNDGGGQDADGYSGTFYGSYYGDRGYFDGIVSYGGVSYDSTRHINLAGIGITDTALGNTDGRQWALGVGGGYDFREEGALVSGSASWTF